MTLVRTAVERTPVDFAVSLYAHGIALHGLGQNTESLRDLRESLDIWQRAAEPDYAQVALLKEAMARCFADLGYSNQAETSQREALAIRAEISDPNR